MCRHLAYVGEPVRVGELLSDPPHGLVRQSWQPRRQEHGLMNVDGFGLGWYPDVETGEASDLRPARHRAAGPIWADETFADLARVIRTRALLAAVRSATGGMPPGPGAAAPFRHERWLFSHNGALEKWPEAAAGLLAGLPPERVMAVMSLEAPTDSALLWAMVLERLAAGTGAADALADVVRQAAAHGGGRLNLLLTDGRSIAATRFGASLVWRRGPGGVVVASEPHDDDPGWHDVPESTALTATPEGVLVRPL